MDDVTEAVSEAITEDTRALRHSRDRLEDFAIAAMRVIRELGGLSAVEDLSESTAFFRSYGALVVNGDVEAHLLEGL